jgi:SAM-dependent methyltransferase
MELPWKPRQQAGLFRCRVRAMTRPVHDDQTLAFYAAEAPVYAASGKGGASAHLHRFLERLAPGARVLELGCGGGRDSEAMIGLGFDVDPTDGVPEITAQAEGRLGRPVRVMRFDELDARGAYDGVWANASLLHVPRAGLPDVLGRVFRALKPGGWHFANYKAEGVDGRDRFGRYFNHPTREDLLALYQGSAPWIVHEAFDYLGGGYDGRQGPWVGITVQKPPA